LRLEINPTLIVDPLCRGVFLYVAGWMAVALGNSLWEYTHLTYMYVRMRETACSHM